MHNYISILIYTIISQEKMPKDNVSFNENKSEKRLPKKSIYHSRSKTLKAFSLIELSVVILVIGIIIAGIAQGTVLIKRTQLKTAQSLTESSPVTAISNLMLWYETSLEKSFLKSEAEDGSEINTWFDINTQSPTKFNATKHNGTTTYSENVFNKVIPGVYFNSGSSLEFDSNGLSGTSFTIFIVEKKESTHSGDNYILGGVTDSTSNSLNISYDSDISINAGIHSQTVNFANGAGLSPIIHSVILSRKSGLKYWENGGVAPEASNDAATTLFDSDGTPVRIGNFLDNTTANSYTGHVAEIIIFTRALRKEERQEIEGYLGQKYKITIS